MYLGSTFHTPPVLGGITGLHVLEIFVPLLSMGSNSCPNHSFVFLTFCCQILTRVTRVDTPTPGLGLEVRGSRCPTRLIEPRLFLLFAAVWLIAGGGDTEGVFSGREERLNHLRINLIDVGIAV